MTTSSDQHVWCWKCGTTKTSPDDRWTRNADNPVLSHDRCATCNDPLMPYPQPTLTHKLNQLGDHLNQAVRWSRMSVVTTTQPTDEQARALADITELLRQATQIYYGIKPDRAR